MISVSHLTKIYKSSINNPGLSGMIENIFNRKYKHTKAVNAISCDVEQGELIGFLGPNGAGKTTTIKMLAGILYPTKGTINVLGFTPFDKKHEFLRQISFVMGQRNQLLWELPATDTFLLNKEIYQIEDKDYKKRLDELVKLLDVKDILTQPIKTLSLGQRMRMELIASLIHHPKVLFLDEPTIGLDVVAQKLIRDFIQEYQTRYKATILLTSHYMEDVRHLCKRVLIIDHGKIIFDGELDKLVKKYASDKIIQVTLDKKPTEDILTKVGSIYEYNYPLVTFKVKKKDIPEVVENITRKLTFNDLIIEEDSIEDVIRKMFGAHYKE